MNWQPIETAPKDGSKIVALVNGELQTIEWGATRWFETWRYEPLYENVPTHWLPITLPEPLKTT